MQRLRARDARHKEEISREANLDLGGQHTADVATHEKAMRDVEDVKSALWGAFLGGSPDCSYLVGGRYV